MTIKKEFFSYYRRLRNNFFSDTDVAYEIKFTKELFDFKSQQLSQDKKRSEFANFALYVVHLNIVISSYTSR